MNRAVILFLFSAILLVLIIYLEPSPYNYRIRGFLGNSVMKKIQIIKVKKDRTLWWAKIKEATFGKDEHIARLKQISLYWPEKNIELIARRGIYNLSSGKIRLEDAIKGYRGDMEIQTDSLRYNPKKQLLYTKDGITIRGKGFTITGNEASIKDGKKLEIKGNVKSVFK